MLSPKKSFIKYGEVISNELITPPCNKGFLGLVKDHLKYQSLNSTQENNLKVYIDAAVDYIEKATSFAILSQTYRLTLDSFPQDDFIDLPIGNVSVVDTFTTYDTANTADATFADYFLDSNKLILNNGIQWPSSIRGRSGVQIEYTSGVASATKVAESITQAVLLLVAHWDANREPVGACSCKEVSYTLSSLININRKRRI